MCTTRRTTCYQLWALLIRWVPFESLLGAVQMHSFQGTVPQTPGYFFPT